MQMTDEEKTKMFMKSTKKELVSMLVLGIGTGDSERGMGKCTAATMKTNNK